MHSPRCIDEVTEKVDVPTVQTMIARGMTTLTGDKDARDSWARFFNADDFVGIKVNASGAPGAMSMPDVVADIVRNLIDRGGQAHQHRDPRARRRSDSPGEIRSVRAGRRPRRIGQHLARATTRASTSRSNFFGEDDTRSYLIRMVTEQFTKIINVPNMKDHGASGVTGCLKNLAYGEFNNVARSHYKAQTETLTFVGTLACDRAAAIAHRPQHHGRLAWRLACRPVLDRQALSLLPEADEVRHRSGGDGPPAHRRHRRQAQAGGGDLGLGARHEVLQRRTPEDWQANPNVNRFIREPGHIEYASTLGLGVYDLKRSSTRRSRYDLGSALDGGSRRYARRGVTVGAMRGGRALGAQRHACR